MVAVGLAQHSYAVYFNTWCFNKNIFTQLPKELRNRRNFMIHNVGYLLFCVPLRPIVKLLSLNEITPSYCKGTGIDMENVHLFP